jgi:hypothetical protein
VRLPRHDRLLRQLREVTVRPLTGGGMSVSSPRSPGGHGDLVSALVLALWQEHGGVEVEAPRIAGGLDDIERRSIERMEARLGRAADAPWWGEEESAQEVPW